MSDLLLHATTKNILTNLLSAKPHSLVITGGLGSGKSTVADYFINNIVDSSESVVGQNYLKISADGDSIGIDKIRQIRDFLGRKTTGHGVIRRAILILDSHNMTPEAQNAILKTLEEPPHDTVIILTSANITSLNTTIRSRIQQLDILPVSEKDALEHFSKSNFSQEEINSAYYISDGRAGLLNSILNHETEHELVLAIQEAKSILRKPIFERLVQIEPLSKQKEQINLLLFGMERIIESGLRLAAKKNNSELVSNFNKIGKLVVSAKSSIKNNVSPKLVLTDLFLNM